MDQGDVSVASDGYNSAVVLVVVDKKYEKEWILDSGCLFHVSPMKHLFQDLQEFDRGRSS